MRLRAIGAAPAGSEGPAVLLLHGFGSSAAGTWVASGWAPRLQAAGRGWIAPDLPGHGESPKPHDPAEYARALPVAALERLLDERGLERVDLVGYSFGAELALGFAALRGERVRRLALGGVGSRQPFAGGAGATLRAHLETGAEIADPVLAAIWKATAVVPGNDPLALLALVDAWPERERGGGPLFTGPALVFRGAADPLAAGAEEIAARLPESRQLVIEGRHHMSTLTAAGLQEEALGFLAGAHCDPGPSPGRCRRPPSPQEEPR